MTFPGKQVVLLALISSCSGPVLRPDGGSGLLPVGSAAPEVVGADASRSEVRLSAMKGHDVVVFFYPKDGSPGCTREVCGFRGAWKEFQQAGIGVIGVSTDSAESHQKWLADEHLQFALASDESGAIAKAFGVGHKFWGDDRVTFLIDGNGRVEKVWPSVDPGIHYKEVLSAAGHPQ